MAAKTAIEKASSASIQPKNAPGLLSPSCHEPIITIGTSTTVSRIITRPRPSTPRA